MFRKLVVPADLAGMFEDFSSCFRGAPAAGVEEVHLVHLFPPRGVRSYFRQIDQPFLEKQAESLRGLGLRVTTHTVVGSPATEINRLAAEQRVDALAVCSLAHGAVEELVLHPVADALLHDARLPLLVLNCGREVAPTEPFEGLLRHLLFATDFSEGAQEAERVLERLAAESKPRVTLVHVQEQRRIFPHLEDRLAEFTRVDRERLRALEQRSRDEGAREVDLHVPCGHPVPVSLETSPRPPAQPRDLGSPGSRPGDRVRSRERRPWCGAAGLHAGAPRSHPALRCALKARSPRRRSNGRDARRRSQPPRA